MYKLCKTEESARRQREIELALFALIKTTGYENVTVTALCERMKMPRKAFYRYFDSLDDAIVGLIDHSMSEYSGFTDDSHELKKRSLVSELEGFFNFWFEKRDLLTAFDRSGLIGIFTDRIINYPISDRIMMIKFLPDEDDKMRGLIFKFALCGLVYMMIDWYRDGFKTPSREMAEAACRMFRKPLFPNLETVGFYE